MSDIVKKEVELLPPDESEVSFKWYDDVETVQVKGNSRPTDLCYTLQCPDVAISIKQIGKRTSIKVENVRQYGDDRDIVLEARFNTIPTEEELEQAIIKIKLAYDAIK